MAVLTARFNPAEEFSRVLQFSRVGESGESYAFSSNGTMLSASRFEDDLRDIGLIEKDESSIINIAIRNPGGNMVEGFVPDKKISDMPLTYMAAQATSQIGKTYSDFGKLGKGHTGIAFRGCIKTCLPVRQVFTQSI